MNLRGSEFPKLGSCFSDRHLNDDYHILGPLFTQLACLWSFTISLASTARFVRSSVAFMFTGSEASGN